MLKGLKVQRLTLKVALPLPLLGESWRTLDLLCPFPVVAEVSIG